MFFQNRIRGRKSQFFRSGNESVAGVVLLVSEYEDEFRAPLPQQLQPLGDQQSADALLLAGGNDGERCEDVEQRSLHFRSDDAASGEQDVADGLPVAQCEQRDGRFGSRIGQQLGGQPGLLVVAEVKRATELIAGCKSRLRKAEEEVSKILES